MGSAQGEEYKSPRWVPLVVSCFCGEAGYHSCTWEFTLWAELRQILQFIIVEPEQQMRARAQRFPFSIWCLWVSVVIKSDDKRPWKEELAFLAFCTLVTSADTEGKFRSIRGMRQRLQRACFFVFFPIKNLRKSRITKSERKPRWRDVTNDSEEFWEAPNNVIVKTSVTVRG